MMRKELVNEKVVRAIAIGLSAVMLTTPMTAMAAEGEEPIDGQEPKEEDVKEGSKYEAAEDAVEAAQESTSEEGAVIVLEETATLPSGKTTDTVPNAADAAGAKELENVTVMDDKGNPTDIDYTDVEADETAANGALVNAEAGLIQTDAAEVAAAVDVEKANEITDEIENNNKVITDASQKASDAADVAAEAAQEAADAKTKADAQAAADKAAQAVAEAEAAQAEAQAAYDENVDKLAAAEAELAAAQANLDAARNSLTASKKDVAEAEAAAEAAEAKAAALKAEVDKEAEALNNSKEAALKAAYEKMMAEKSVSNLYDGDSFDEDGVDDKFVDTFGTESAGSGYWKAADEYFELYLKYVYGDNYVKGKWEKSNTLDNDLVYDAERDNVFTVTYKDEEGKEVTALYNYHTADKDGNISIYEKQVGTETIVHTTTETSSVDALSIKNTDEEGNVTYTKYDDNKKDTDVVVSVAKDEEGNDTSILVKDDNSKQTASVDDLDVYKKSLGKNQEVSVSEETTTTYEAGEITVVDSYEQKEEFEKSYDDFDSKNDFKNKVAEALEEGKAVEVKWDGLFGSYKISPDDVDGFTMFVNELAKIIGLGLEMDVYNLVDDTARPKDTHTEQGIIVKTSAEVTTTTEHEVSDDGFFDGFSGWEWINGEDKAEAAAKEKIKELATEYNLPEDAFEYDVKQGRKGYEYEITFSTTETLTQTIKTDSYTATAYEMNTIVTEKTIETSVETEYWTERKNTTNDQKVKDAITNVENLLKDMKDKQDAAAIALIAAQEAKKDVVTAKAELEKLSVDDAAYQEALANYKTAKADFDAAQDKLDAINEDVEEAQQDYEDAAAELGRFVPTPSAGGDGAGDDGDNDTTPIVVPVVTPVENPAAVVTPIAVGAGTGAGAGQVVVAIDDEATPLAAGIDNANGNGDANGGDGEDVIIAAADEDENAIVAIEDEETPLASGVNADAKMSWWWLLIVAVLGATGYKMYKEHQKKKEEAAKEV